MDREETADELSTIIQPAIFGLACFLVLGVLPSICLIFDCGLYLYSFYKSDSWHQDYDFGAWVVIFVLAQVVANILGLTTISWLINQIITYGVIAAVVIFSPEIRTGLERLGRATDFFSTTQISAEEKMIRALC